MSLVHTIQLVGNHALTGTVSSTRTSASRRYVACTVATATERTVAIEAAEKAKMEADLVSYRAKLAELTARLGMTVEQAKTRREAARQRWYNEEDGLFATQRRIETERGYEGVDAIRHCHAVARLAEADLIRRGFENPYDKQGAAGIVDVAHDVARCERTLANWRPLAVGSQGVLAWHLSVPNAAKGNFKHWTARGYRLDVRTDIAVRETAKRSKKS